MPCRILIVDDSAAIRQAVRSCIEENTEWEICGEAENGNTALDMVRALKPDLMVLDLMMPGTNGLEVAREIARRGLGTRIVMFTSADCEGLIREARNVGISRVITKSGDGIVNHLLAAIRDVFREHEAA